MPDTRGLLFIRACTSLHAGAGTSVGAIDLPVQRECHTAWPMIQSSGVKGVMRDKFRLSLGGSRADADRNGTLTALFGPPTDFGNDDYAGALAITDARILAFPVRSGKGVFAWVTCRAVLERLLDDLALLGAPAPFTLDGTAPAMAQCACTDAAWAELGIALGDNTRIILEDVLIEERLGALTTLADDASQWIASRAMGLGNDVQFADPRKRLVILDNDVFTHFVKYATEVQTRIKLDYDTKTVAGGALFSQESLPPETLLYAMVLAEKPRDGGNAQVADAAGVYAAANGVFANTVLQLGGDETTGKGLCKVRLAGLAAVGGAQA